LISGRLCLENIRKAESGFFGACSSRSVKKKLRNSDNLTKNTLFFLLLGECESLASGILLYTLNSYSITFFGLNQRKFKENSVCSQRALKVQIRDLLAQSAEAENKGDEEEAIAVGNEAATLMSVWRLLMIV
jgi:hypothetical protein